MLGQNPSLDLQSPQTAPSLPQGVYDECAEKQTNSDANRYLNHACRHAENLQLGWLTIFADVE